VKKIFLKIIFACACLEPLSVLKAQTILFQENFTSGSLPAGWTNDSLGMPAFHGWEFLTPGHNPFSRVITGAGFDDSFAIFDGDQGDTNDSIPDYASLTTQDINIAGATNTMHLEFDEQFKQYTTGTDPLSTRRVEYSIDHGSTWTTLIFDSSETGYPVAVHTTYDISIAVGSPTLSIRFTYTGDFHWWWAIDNVTIIYFPGCLSAPDAGSASTTTGGFTCSGSDFNLSLTGADTLTPVSIQWQSSPDSITWTNIPGATNTLVTVSQTSPTYYRSLSSCLPLSSISNTLFVDMNPPVQCYCIPPHVVDCNGAGMEITNVSILGTGLNNSSGCDQLTAQGYTSWPAIFSTVANLTRNTIHDFSVTTNGNNSVSIWIDFNADGLFDATTDEYVQVCTTSVSGIPNIISFTIPATATVGPTIMRVRSRANTATNDSTSSCVSFGSGESEDYVIGIEFNVDVQEMKQEKSIILYPNPTAGQLSVFLRENDSGTSIQIVDVIGNIMQNSLVKNTLRTDFDMTSFSDGVYFVTVRNKNEIVTQKIILNK